MSENKVEYGKNIDVFDLKTGDGGTIEDYIDIGITKNTAIRVCLVSYENGLRRELKIDRQLVIALDKHENQTINSYKLVYFYNDEVNGVETKILGEGNLLKQLYDIVTTLQDWNTGKQKVMLLIGKDIGVVI